MGKAPSGVQEAEPPGGGGAGAKPPEAEGLSVFCCLKEAANVSPTNLVTSTMSTTAAPKFSK